jgi:hypothetical protein
MRAERSRAIGAAAMLWCAGAAQAAGSLDIPDTIGGYPTNVGLLFLGHSTSAQGAYPAKLVAALNDPAHPGDGRHYQPFHAVTGGDGGLLWSLLSVSPTDARYDRVMASQTVGESPQPQWCQTLDQQRWSCRRAKVEHLLTGTFPIPADGTCADATVNSCRQPATIACTWYDRNLPLAQNPVTQQLAPDACWAKMDYRVALLQDTSNRSWPLDDYDADGDVDANEFWPASRVPRARALPCPISGGVVSGAVDWNCNLLLDSGDALLAVSSGWLRTLAESLLDPARGAAALDGVIVSQKPVEMGQCQLWPLAERNTCNLDRHARRTPEWIAATPDRPLDHYYLPTVYWEHRQVEALLAAPALDPRILASSPGDSLALWNRSARCYADGLGAADWRIPAAVPGRPTVIAADDSEIDGVDADAVGCMVADHVHHNDAGGWMMADHWYAGLAAPLWTGTAQPIFADGFESP